MSCRCLRAAARSTRAPSCPSATTTSAPDVESASTRSDVADSVTKMIRLPAPFLRMSALGGVFARLSMTTRTGFSSLPESSRILRNSSDLTVKLGSSERIVPIPTMMASVSQRNRSTRWKSRSPEIRTCFLRCVEIFPSALMAAFINTNGCILSQLALPRLPCALKTTSGISREFRNRH